MTAMLLSRPVRARDACAIVETAGRDRTLVDSITSLLEQHGVQTRAARCRENRAQVLVDEMADAAWIAITIRDSEGKEVSRRIQRDERTAAVAASLVESFVLGEDADLLSRPGTAVTDDATGTAAASSRWLGQATLLGGFLFGSDSSTWYGVQLDVCARVAWACAGVRGRLAHDDGGEGISSDLVRSQWDGAAFLGVPFEGRRWQLQPALALGVTYTRSSLFPSPFRMSISDYDLRGQLSLSFAAFLSTSWALRVEVAEELGFALSHASRELGDRLSSLLTSFVPEPPGRLTWLALGLEYRL